MMLRSSRLLCAAAALYAVSALAANPPRLAFTRTLPASHDLGSAHRIAVIYALGDNPRIDAFVDLFVDQVNRSGTLRVDDAVERNHHQLADLTKVRKDHPADLYFGIHQFTCTSNERSAEGSERDVDGGRIRRTHQWVDAACSARIDVMKGNDGKKVESFSVHGDGTSPRSTALTDEEREIAFEQAMRYAAVAAAESITPRSVRESIELDPAAPSFDEGYAMITSDRLSDARAIWEATSRRHHQSAALFYDLAAVCEALGDVKEAQRYFDLALQLSPSDARYKAEVNMFRHRNSL